jgi:hypothetical protein
MKNITLSADEKLIELAREKARSHNRSFNDEFRLWLRGFVGDSATGDYQSIMSRLSHIAAGGHFSRDEANGR